jgi:hypothetical protein
MYHFVFQNARHRASAGWRGRYTPIQTAHNAGEFDRRLLNKSLKDYHITGCGEHKIQHLLCQVGLREVFFGHILRVETKKQAMWVKLNFDVCVRKDLKFVDLYLDLSAEQIEQESKRWHELNREEQLAAAHNNQSGHLVRYAADGLKKVKDSPRYTDQTSDAFEAALVAIQAENRKFNQQFQALVKQKEQEAARLRTLVESHKVGGSF